MTNPISLITLPEYYPLFAVYFDYLVNHQHHLAQEQLRRIQQSLRSVHARAEVGAPWRKSWTLRLFTERFLLERFPPHLVKEAWLFLREELEGLPLQEAGDQPPRGERTPRRARPKPASLPETPAESPAFPRPPFLPPESV
ncbi:MAG: hypothetical protein OEV94_01710 [Deltaproteobacteria bacterium]|nr:hypothetical protein [Deltaproteobacteria bacterium]